MKNLNQVAYENIKNPQRFLEFEVDRSIYIEEMNFIIKKIDEMIEEFSFDKFPSEFTKNHHYDSVDNVWGWTTSFWTGMIWLAYEWTGDDKYKEIGLKHVADFKHRLDNKLHLDHHDIGFLYILSCVASYKLTGDEFAKEVALEAADLLAERYVDKVKFIDRGRVEGAPENEAKFIIDCNMNIPLLYWASEVTGDSSYYEKAYNHISQSAAYAVREDGSSYQGVIMDRYTGEHLRCTVGQGHDNTSTWARGQAWGIYGYPLSYSYTKDASLLDIGKKVCNYYLNRLPEDDICAWDLIFMDNDVQRDTSAATPAICGMLELAKHLPITDPDKVLYEKAALKMLKTLSESYTTKKDPKANGLLLHGVYTYKMGTNLDDLCIWGDYYYMEALMRVLRSWNMYW